jgi:hypothetical protein
MIIGDTVVIPKFDETLLVVVLPTFPIEKVVVDDKFDDTVVLINDDKVVRVVFDKLLVFNKLLLVELMNCDRVVVETFRTVVLIVEEVLVVVLTVVGKFKKTVLFNNEDEFS